MAIYWIDDATEAYEQECRGLEQQARNEQRQREIAAFERWQRISRSIGVAEADRFRRLGTPATDRGF